MDAAVAIVADALPELGADAGFVATLDPDGRTLDVARVTQYSRAPTRLSFSVDSPYPLAQAVRNGERLFIASNFQLACDHPGLVRVNSDDHACATIPLVQDEHVLGAVNIAFEDPHEFSTDEIERVEQVARRCRDALAHVSA